MSNPSGAARRALDAVVEQGRAPGLQYVAVDRSAALLDYAGGFADLASSREMTSAATLMAYSMSKTVTAAAVLQLIESGAVGLDTPVADYLDWQPYGSAITVRQLISHTSGAPNPLPLRWVHPAAEHATFDEHAALVAVLRAHPRLAFAPGAKYKYSNIGYWLLGGIVERAAGRPFTTQVVESVFRPLGIPAAELAYTVMDRSAHASGYLEKYSFINALKSWLIDRALIGEYSGSWLRIRDHYPNGPAFGGLVGSARGFGRFLQDQLRDRSQALGDTARALLEAQQETSAGRPVPMTLGWHVRRVAPRVLFKEGGGGGFHCLMRLYPDNGIGTVIMTNATGGDVHALLDSADGHFLSARR